MLSILTDLVHYFVTVISTIFSVITDYHSRKILLFAVLIFISFRINVYWIFEPKIKNHISTVAKHLSYVNVLITVICMKVELLINLYNQWPASDLFCRITKFLQTTSLNLSTGFILQIVILFKFPEKNRRRIRGYIVTIWFASLFFALPQLGIFGSYAVGPNNSTQCTVEQQVPVGFEDVLLFLKYWYFAGPLTVILAAHAFLYLIFMGKETGNYWRKHAKDKWKMLKLYLITVFNMHCLFVAFSIYSIYVPFLRSLVEQYHFALLEAGCIFSMLNPFLLRKIFKKITSAETFPKQRYNRISSTSSSSSSLNSVSSQLSDDSTSSSFDSFSIQLSDDNDGISPSSSLNTVSIELSDGDDNLRPIKSVRKVRSIAK